MKTGIEMTRRDLAAIVAMRCVLSNERIMTEAALHCEEKSIPEQVAETAVSMADALIRELEKANRYPPYRDL